MTYSPSFPPSRATHHASPCFSHVVVTALALCLLLGLSVPLSAQGKSHGFVTAGTGATDLDAGLDFLLPGGPIGVGVDVGLGWAFLAQLTGSYHFLAARHGRHDLFATVGIAALGSSEFSSQGATVGGGAVFWPARHVGLRLDAFRYLVLQREDHVSPDRRSDSTYWGVRAGVAFRFH